MIKTFNFLCLNLLKITQDKRKNNNLSQVRTNIVRSQHKEKNIPKENFYLRLKEIKSN